jgi:hypothetical protein
MAMRVSAIPSDFLPEQRHCKILVLRYLEWVTVGSWSITTQAFVPKEEQRSQGIFKSGTHELMNKS